MHPYRDVDDYDHSRIPWVSKLWRPSPGLPERLGTYGIYRNNKKPTVTLWCGGTPVGAHASTSTTPVDLLCINVTFCAPKCTQSHSESLRSKYHARAGCFAPSRSTTFTSICISARAARNGKQKNTATPTRSAYGLWNIRVCISCRRESRRVEFRHWRVFTLRLVRGAHHRRDLRMFRIY